MSFKEQLEELIRSQGYAASPGRRGLVVRDAVRREGKLRDQTAYVVMVNERGHTIQIRDGEHGNFRTFLTELPEALGLVGAVGPSFKGSESLRIARVASVKLGAAQGRKTTFLIESLDGRAIPDDPRAVGPREWIDRGYSRQFTYVTVDEKGVYSRHFHMEELTLPNFEKSEAASLFGREGTDGKYAPRLDSAKGHYVITGEELRQLKESGDLPKRVEGGDLQFRSLPGKAPEDLFIEVRDENTRQSKGASRAHFSKTLGYLVLFAEHFIEEFGLSPVPTSRPHKEGQPPPPDVHLVAKEAKISSSGQLLKVSTDSDGRIVDLHSRPVSTRSDVIDTTSGESRNRELLGRAAVTFGVTVDQAEGGLVEPRLLNTDKSGRIVSQLDDKFVREKVAQVLDALQKTLPRLKR